MIILGTQISGGKTALQQKKWATLKCMDCGGQLKIEKDDEYESIKVCERCGSRVLLIKKPLKSLKGKNILPQ